MQYKFTKDYGFFKTGDILNWDEDINAFTLDVETENGFRAAMLDERTAEDIYDQGFLSASIEPKNEANEAINKTVELIDSLLDTYANDYKEMKDKADKGEVQPCVRVEAETVYYNLNKVLTKIKDTLKNE